MNPTNRAPSTTNTATDPVLAIRANTGIALLIVGLVVPVILVAMPIAGNSRLVAVAATAAILQTVALIFGVRSWQRPSGKIITITASILLILLAIYVAFVTIVAESASRGAPM